MSLLKTISIPESSARVGRPVALKQNLALSSAFSSYVCPVSSGAFSSKSLRYFSFVTAPANNLLNSFSLQIQVYFEQVQ